VTWCANIKYEKKNCFVAFSIKKQLHYITKYTRSSGGEMREKHDCTGSQKHNPAIPKTCEDIINSNRKLRARLKSYLLWMATLKFHRKEKISIAWESTKHILSRADDLPNRNTSINQHQYYNCNPEPIHANIKKQWQQYWLQTLFSYPGNYHIQTRSMKESYTTTIA
jgi:hypothetical protein